MPSTQASCDHAAGVNAMAIEKPATLLAKSDLSVLVLSIMSSISTGSSVRPLMGTVHVQMAP